MSDSRDLTPDMLKEIKKGTKIQGVLLCQSYTVALTKAGKEYVTGNFQSGMNIAFKAWNSSDAFGALKKENYQGLPVYITGEGDDFGGTISITLDTISAVDGFIADMFYPVRYNIDAYWTALINTFKSKTSDKAMEIANIVLFQNADTAERFKVEFAATSHHDNCKSGLLAHTYKVVYNVAHLLSMYPSIPQTAGGNDYTDIIYLGALLHDIGKIDEMKFGVYQPESCVTHRYLGLQRVMQFKDKIVELYGEKLYLELVSIMLQHHGDYAEPCKTISAYIVHKADEWDSVFTVIAHGMEAMIDTAVEHKIKVNDNYLTF